MDFAGGQYGIGILSKTELKDVDGGNLEVRTGDEPRAWQKVLVEVDGKEIAIYRDKEGLEHKVYTKCPHMGCRLIFNEYELTWDCPCHGSRFDYMGRNLYEPSIKDLDRKA